MLALDLFAGTGWGVACQRLGIEEHGVELMPAAIATRDAAGMSTILEDVWTGLPHDIATAEPWGYDLLIASPPCQTFRWRKPGDGPRQNTVGSVHITLEQAAMLQSYPADFPFQGTKSQRFLQVGNAVPPLLAEAVLGSLGPSRVVDRYPRLP